MKQNRVLLKFGGELLQTREQHAAQARSVMEVMKLGLSCILCHGGGPQISKNMEHASLKPSFVRGKRVTDEQTLRILVNTLLGEINAPFVASLNAAGVPALGMTGADSNLLMVRQIDQELGYVGEVTHVNTLALEQQLSFGLTPLIACLGVDPFGHLFNVNADDLASALSTALHAKTLVLLSNVDGIYSNFPDPQSRIPLLHAEELQSMLLTSMLSAGMIPKVEAALLALQGGVQEVWILHGAHPQALLSVLRDSTERSFGTRIVP